MSRRYFWMPLFVLMGCFFLPSVAEALTTVYEPRDFVRKKGAPASEIDTFMVCDPTGVFRLVVENGGAEGRQCVSSGVIIVNGAAVVTQRDFKKNFQRIERPLKNLKEENRISVKLNSQPGSYLTLSVEGDMHCLNLDFTSPVNGSLLEQATAVVRGTINAQSADVGIEVNGRLAEVSGSRWAVADVPLAPGENVITAVARDGDGNTDEKSINVRYEKRAVTATLSASPHNGIVPLDVGFAVDVNNINSISIYKIDFDGDGIFDFETTSLEGISHTYETEGLYTPVVTVKKDDGTVVSAATVVNALLREEADSRLKSKWDAMRNALNEGKIEEALFQFTADSTERYRGIFKALESRLPDIAAGMEEIQLIYMKDDRAKYRIRRQEDAGEITYYIYFVRDSDGLWKIHRF